jgi:uncharacterized protein YgiM (DUF1202 family)
MVTLKKGFFVTLIAVFLASVIWAAEESKPAPETNPLAAAEKAPETPVPQQPPAQPAAPAPAAPAAEAKPVTPAPAAPAPEAQPVTPPAAQPQPASPAVTEEAKAAKPQFPYVAEIIGTEVFVRSGPGTAYYHCGKLNAPQRVTVVGFTHNNWFQILPPPGSFSWISKTYVEIDKTNPKKGTVTGDAVRIWAGSDFVEPMRSSSLQTKLNKGAAVEIVGELEVEGDYYKITPPSDAYLWISGDSLKALKKEETKPEPKKLSPAWPR